MREHCEQNPAVASKGGLPARQEQPAAFIVPARRKLELVMSEDRRQAVAILIQNFPTSVVEIEACYAFGHGIWSDCNKLARRWQVWAVFADPAWAEGQVKRNAARPTGIAFAIL